MDDPALYGEVAFRLPRGEAEERGLVVPSRWLKTAPALGNGSAPRPSPPA